MAKPKLAAVPDPLDELDIDRGLGEVIVPVQPWETLGEITRFESGEIKRRNEVLTKLNVEIADLASLRAMASNEKNHFLHELGRKFGSGPRDEINVNDETGLVSRVGTRRYVQPEPTIEPTVEETASPEDDQLN